MALHILEGMYPFEELLKSSNKAYNTLHPQAQLVSQVYQDGDFSSVAFSQAPVGPAAHLALIVKRDVFCNALVIVHVVNQVLEPQGSNSAREEPPRDLAALKEMASSVTDMDM